MFRVTEPYSIEQLKAIKGVLRKHGESVQIVYQSNWYIVVACLDLELARTVRAQLNRNMYHLWHMEIRQGRKTDHHYIQIKFNRS
jgi:hypothetical protein